MKVKEVMTPKVIRISPEETAAVAARTLTHYNIGVLPVCGADGDICGVLTDRDIVTRCLAAGRSASTTSVREIMTTGIVSASPDMDVERAADLMGQRQIRRLPVTENGRLCGMLSLGDLARKPQSSLEAGDALTQISSRLSRRS